MTSDKVGDWLVASLVCVNCSVEVPACVDSVVSQVEVDVTTSVVVVESQLEVEGVVADEEPETVLL
jgi:hypothetical protein